MMYAEDVLYIIRQTLNQLEWRFESDYRPQNENETKKLIDEIFYKIPLTGESKDAP